MQTQCRRAAASQDETTTGVPASHMLVSQLKGGQVGLQKESREERLSESEKEKFFALVENSLDFIGMASLDGAPFYLNRAGRELVGLAAEVEVTQTKITDYCDPETASLLLDTAIPTSISAGYWIGEGHLRHFGTQSLIPVLIHTILVRDPRTGEALCLATSQRNITDIKEAGKKLQKAHEELVKISRLAGMAEVATGVLHNVGNVLTSINVSTTLMTEQVTRSKAGHLARISAMLRERDGDLAEFLKNDPKGREIPAYLEGLAEQFLADQQQVLTELDSLRKNINHIKDIVALQQRYGRLSGGREAVSVSELVENALQINAGTLDRHRIKIQSDFQADPTVTLEKHKVLQILVNLIRNAKYACDEGGRPEKLLIVRITGDSERARIAIIDNGAGISPENLTHIFTYGFTTRKDGHGFGLHSAALTAKELGGTLSVQSDGPGQGATFVLEIPYQPPGAAL